MTQLSLAVKDAWIGKAQVGATFIVRDDNGKVGTLTVSRGGVRWLPRSHKRGSKGHYIAWEDLDEAMREYRRS